MGEEVREESAGVSGTTPETPPADECAPSPDEAAEESAEVRPPSDETASEESVEDAAASGEPSEKPPAEEGDREEGQEEDRLRWYVVHTSAGHEEKAASNIERAVKQAGLQDQVPRVLVPTEKVAEMRNGKKTITDRKFFPSYVLVRMEMSDETWRVISNTPGVTRFVGVGTKPQPISNEEIERILGRVEGTKEKPTPTIPYHVGEHVKVTDGPFTEFTGVVDEIQPDRGKLKVMVSIFGRPVPVELDFLQVKSL
jgi:transcriptional antiterminator NusG